MAKGSLLRHEHDKGREQHGRGDFSTVIEFMGEPNDSFTGDSHIDLTNPDFVAYAESFGARGYRVESVDQLLPTLVDALNCGTVAVVDCPVDYAENMKLTEHLGEIVCPI